MLLQASMKIKVVTGFREDQYFIIDGEEAHKAYYLFLNPEERAVFENGQAIIGKNIQEIKPAYNETMGWNPTHELDSDDWNDMRAKGIDRKLNLILSEAKQVAYQIGENPKLLSLPLSEARIADLKALE